MSTISFVVAGSLIGWYLTVGHTVKNIVVQSVGSAQGYAEEVQNALDEKSTPVGSLKESVQTLTDQTKESVQALEDRRKAEQYIIDSLKTSIEETSSQ